MAATKNQLDRISLVLKTKGCDTQQAIQALNDIRIILETR